MRNAYRSGSGPPAGRPGRGTSRAAPGRSGHAQGLPLAAQQLVGGVQHRLRWPPPAPARRYPPGAPRRTARARAGTADGGRGQLPAGHLPARPGHADDLIACPPGHLGWGHPCRPAGVPAEPRGGAHRSHLLRLAAQQAVPHGERRPGRGGQRLERDRHGPRRPGRPRRNWLISARWPLSWPPAGPGRVGTAPGPDRGLAEVVQPRAAAAAGRVQRLLREARRSRR